MLYPDPSFHQTQSQCIPFVGRVYTLREVGLVAWKVPVLIWCSTSYVRPNDPWESEERTLKIFPVKIINTHLYIITIRPSTASFSFKLTGILIMDLSGCKFAFMNATTVNQLRYYAFAPSVLDVYLVPTYLHYLYYNYIQHILSIVWSGTVSFWLDWTINYLWTIGYTRVGQ